MKPFILTSCTLALMLVVCAPAYADTASSTLDTQSAISPTAEHPRASTQDTAREGHEGVLSKVLQDRIRNLIANVVERLAATLHRFDTIVTRIDSRIEKLNAAQMDTTAASAKLSEAKDALEHARTLLAQTPDSATVVTSETPRTAYKAIRAQLIAVRDELKHVRNLLQEAVTLLKNTSARPSEEATTTEPLPAQ